jgi:CheY-like chemotaxis protein
MDKRIKILVADDNEDAAAALSMLLEEMGHVVWRVNGGKQAVQAAGEFNPHLALLDIGMPGVNGFDACAQIRLQPGGGSINIVAVTGWGQPEDVRKSRASGFDDHLVKPVDPAELLQLVARVADQQKPAQEL